MAASLRASVSSSEVVFITDSDAEIGSLWSIDSEAVRCMGTWRPFTNTIVPTPSTTDWAWLVRRRVGGTTAASHTNGATITEYSPEKPSSGGGPHTHPESDVTNLTSDLAGKSGTSHNHDSAYAPTHSHPYAATSHGHAQSDVTNLVSDLSGKAASGHAHAGTYEPAGTVATHAAAGNPHPTYATDADLTTHAGTPHGGSLPAGLIVMWGGLVANIPSGWVLCNGQNGTPDLRDRFIKGATAEAGATGGSATHGHTVTQPAAHADHTLSGSIATENAHTHTVAGVVQHTHVMTASNTVATSGSNPARGTGTQGSVTAPNPAGSVASPLPTSAGSAHTHGNGTLAVSAHGAHSGASVNTVNSEPAYFALCFIQKT